MYSPTKVDDPMIGMMKLMTDEVHTEFVNKYLLHKEYQESCIMFMTFFSILMDTFPDKNGKDLLDMLREAHSNSIVRREMIHRWTSGDLKKIDSRQLKSFMLH